MALFKGLSKKKELWFFLNPEMDPLGVGYNVIQSKIAIGSGGFFGKGYMHGTQGSLNFIPSHHTDFIFSVIGEELGFWGLTTVIFLYAIVIFQGIQISIQTESSAGTLISIGIISIITSHLFENVGMCLGMMPVTGIPLPFISYGPTYLTVSMICIALLINIKIRRHFL